MPIIAKGGGNATEFKHLEAGSYIARCVSLWSIGSQFNKWHDKWSAQVIIRWEVPEETAEDGNPATICAFYTLSLHEKSNLYKALVAWRGRQFTDDELARFDLEAVLGAPCLLTVTHTDEGKQRVSGVSKLGKGMICPEAVHALEVYSMDDDPGGEKYAALPDWVKAQIDNSRERMPITEGADNSRPPQPETVDEDAFDAIPF